MTSSRRIVSRDPSLSLMALMGPPLTTAGDDVKEKSVGNDGRRVAAAPPATTPGFMKALGTNLLNKSDSLIQTVMPGAVGTGLVAAKGAAVSAYGRDGVSAQQPNDQNFVQADQSSA